MKLTKKLLTALLPIATTGALVPAVTSCNKGNGYVINYGDEINCLDEKGIDYHSLNDVKNSIKSHVSIEQMPTMTVAELVEIRNGEMGRQKAYFDLVATLAIKNETKFHLKFNKETKYVTLIYLDKDGKQQTAEADIDWSTDHVPQPGEQLPLYIGVVNLFTREGYKQLSYMYQNTKLIRGE